MKCSICEIHKAEHKDYRFIDSCGLQGKVLSCKWCFGLADKAIKRIFNGGLDPIKFYNKTKDERS